MHFSLLERLAVSGYYLDHVSNGKLTLMNFTNQKLSKILVRSGLSHEHLSGCLKPNFRLGDVFLNSLQ